MIGEIVGNLLFQPRINVRVIVAIRDHTTGTVERDISDATPLAIAEATRLMHVSAEHVRQFFDAFTARNHHLAHHNRIRRFDNLMRFNARRHLGNLSRNRIRLNNLRRGNLSRHGLNLARLTIGNRIRRLLRLLHRLNTLNRLTPHARLTRLTLNRLTRLSSISHAKIKIRHVNETGHRIQLGSARLETSNRLHRHIIMTAISAHRHKQIPLDTKPSHVKRTLRVNHGTNPNRLNLIARQELNRRTKSGKARQQLTQHVRIENDSQNTPVNRVRISRAATNGRNLITNPKLVRHSDAVLSNRKSQSIRLADLKFRHNVLKLLNIADKTTAKSIFTVISPKMAKLRELAIHGFQNDDIPTVEFTTEKRGEPQTRVIITAFHTHIPDCLIRKQPHDLHRRKTREPIPTITFDGRVPYARHSHTEPISGLETQHSITHIHVHSRENWTVFLFGNTRLNEFQRT